MSVRDLFKRTQIGPQTPVGETSQTARDPTQGSNAHRLRLEVLEDIERAGAGWLWATDAKGRLIYISENAALLLKRPVIELQNHPFAELFETVQSDSEQSARPLHFRMTMRGKIIDLPVASASRESQPGAERTWWSISGYPKFDSSGEFLGYRGSAKDITAEHQRSLEDAILSEYDALTRLANRSRMTRRLTAILRAFMSTKRACALLTLDLDRFKAVNDTMGHPAGDELLRQVSERLRKVVGQNGEIGRLGGDEFQIILPDFDDRGELGELSVRLIKMISQPYRIEGKRVVIGVSVGVAIAPYDAVEIGELVSHSDLALYAAKHGGRGQFRFYSHDMKNKAEEHRLIEADLRTALLEGQLDLYYQPVVRVSDHVVVSFAATIRWDHPERGIVAPEVFLPIAGETNLVNEIGDWVLRRACHDALQWPEPIHVSVKIADQQFSNAALRASVENVLAKSGLAPQRLELEFGESIFRAADEVDDKLRLLKAIGINLVLGDFGTGFSSLAFLRSASFAMIKVGSPFVECCTPTDSKGSELVSAIMALLSALGVDGILQGIEALDQFHVACTRGARFIEGSIYSEPLPQEEILQNLAAQNFRIEPTGPDQFRPERRSMYRQVGVIHQDYRYQALMRELSKSGACIEGLLGVPVGTGLVLDLGGGQLIVCTVISSEEGKLTVDFETHLVSDGAGGLCTRHRVSPYALAAAGMPLVALSEGQISALGPGHQCGRPQFLQVTAART